MAVKRNLLLINSLKVLTKSNQLTINEGHQLPDSSRLPIVAYKARNDEEFGGLQTEQTGEDRINCMATIVIGVWHLYL